MMHTTRSLLICFLNIIPILASPLITKRAAISCPGSDQTLYTTPSGVSYTIECGANHPGLDTTRALAYTFEDCLDSCSADSSCTFATYIHGGGFCYKKNNTQAYSSPADSFVWSARLAPSLPTAPLICPGSHGSVFTTGGKSFMVECYTTRDGNDLSAVPATSLNSCVQSCASNASCVAGVYVPDTAACWMKKAQGIPAENTGVASFRMIEAGAIVGNSLLQTHPQWSGFQGVEYWFAFGDSYSTTSFNILGAQPSHANPTGNPSTYQTTSIGPNYLLYLAETYNKSSILLYDLAESGAILPDPSALGLPAQLPQAGYQQVQFLWLETYASTRAVPWQPSNALFSFWFGINDLDGLVDQTADVAASHLTADIAAYRAQLDFVYARGGRNFLIINVPPVDRSPGWMVFRSAAERVQLAGLIKTYNAALAGMVGDVKKAYRDANVFLYDAWTTVDAVITDPKSRAETAGLGTTADYCVAYAGTFDPAACNSTCVFGCVDKYMWQDVLHPTYVVHRVIAREIVTLLG